MKSRVTQILIILYLLLTFKMYVDEQGIPLCALILYGYIWLIRNWGIDDGTPVVKLVYRALIFALVLIVIAAVVKSVWWIIPVIVFMIYTNLDNAR